MKDKMKDKNYPEIARRHCIDAAKIFGYPLLNEWLKGIITLSTLYGICKGKNNFSKSTAIKVITRIKKGKEELGEI